MVAALKYWEPQVRQQARDWVTLISRGDANAVWDKLFAIVSRHSAVRSLYASKDLSWDSLQETCRDLTQDLYLKLEEKDRWQYYVDQDYSNERVEHELYGIEVPNLISRLLRQRYPETYRLARRTSNLLMTKKVFRCYSRTALFPRSDQGGVSRGSNKMVLQVYGLAEWSPDKPVRQQQHLQERIKGVACRLRDTRRAGRGSSSQVVISNEALTQLIVDIFRTIDSPTDVRTMRSLVMSKLAVEDSEVVSMEETRVASNADSEAFQVDFADTKPTPEEVVLEKETVERMESLADTVLQRCREEVNNKPPRFRKLLEVVYHCYFNQSSPSQTNVARLMAISDSLVSHYRKIFDAVVRNEDLTLDECIYLNGALERRVTELMAREKAAQRKREQVAEKTLSSHLAAEARPKYMVACASSGC